MIHTHYRGPNVLNTLHVTHRDEWRKWLEQHHDAETEIWLIFYKKHTGQARVAYDDAVEEALCFGWIDSIVKRMDDERYAQKFTPRRKGSNWSELNLGRVRRLIQEGRMTDAGLAKIDPANVRQKPQSEPTTAKLVIPVFLKRAMQTSPPAWRNFMKLAPSYRGNYIRWIMAAKRDETRARRLQEAITNLKQNKKLGLK
jgi:uncharacterized protein YdeI (YjbR/CyaY-like superfamily)